ncbi:MAG TPA: HEAT repeat domain-containing protein [Candidatus Wallbacteria bacterium]|nr:MAG: hypothetical protein BWY32_00894 [bacterium ADurb.Bin243]HOD38977.1 HEAT repeat domain-containing protein [Candidatus Wallbacteria bacterium]HPG57631.1 HEAT repeat domain-containing protein [Candidatus Wallbacteria bacterium]
MKETENEDQISFTEINFDELSSGPEQYIQTLIVSLGNPDERVRKYAFQVMCELADERAVKILTGYLNHRDNLVRYSVKKALEAIKEKRPGRFEEIISGGQPKVGTNYALWIIVLAAFMVTSSMTIVFINRGEVDNKAKNSSTAGKKNKTASQPVSPANVITYDAKGVPTVKITGIVSAYNSIKREAGINLNSYGDFCKIIFADDMKIDFTLGSKIELTAEILHNDNINPVILKAVSYKLLKQ